MARIIPDGWRELSVTGAAQREIETLAVLADGLPDDYTVYHAVHWTGIDGHFAIYGEIDFAVVNLAGDLLLIEQKCGFLDETAAGLVKQYPGKSKSVPGADLAHGQPPARQARGPRRHSLGRTPTPSSIARTTRSGTPKLPASSLNASSTPAAAARSAESSSDSCRHVRRRPPRPRCTLSCAT
jgi:hypothetical protein